MDRRTTPLPAPAPDVDVSVIVPTYCEAANLPVLIPRIHAALIGGGYSGEIIVVDDNSPDDTRAVCARLARNYPARLEVRLTERGLSSAVLHGMHLASGRVLAVMDADLSHPPEKLPELIAALGDNGAIMALGSRYVSGAAIADRWGLFRRLNSGIATLLARPFTATSDPMSGFFAIRNATFAAARGLDPIGYKIGLELLVKCAHGSAQEIPITFEDRLYGQSKLSLKEQLNYLKHLKRLFEFKMGELALPIQFGAVGLTGVAVDMTCFSGLLPFVSLPLARALSICCAMSWNFWLNRRLTFSYARHEAPWRQYAMFCASCLVGAVANWSTSVALWAVSPFFARHALVVAGAGVAAGFIFNYGLSRHLAFPLRLNQRLPLSTPAMARIEGPQSVSREFE